MSASAPKVHPAREFKQVLVAMSKSLSKRYSQEYPAARRFYRFMSVAEACDIEELTQEWKEQISDVPDVMQAVQDGDESLFDAPPDCLVAFELPRIYRNPRYSAKSKENTWLYLKRLVRLADETVESKDDLDAVIDDLGPPPQAAAAGPNMMSMLSSMTSAMPDRLIKKLTKQVVEMQNSAKDSQKPPTAQDVMQTMFSNLDVDDMKEYSDKWMQQMSAPDLAKSPEFMRFVDRFRQAGAQLQEGAAEPGDSREEPHAMDQQD